MKKKLTVIIPSYNFENDIEDCVVSVHNQKTNFEFDVVLRDDGSTDSTKEKLKSLEKRILFE
jgi:glycosyltransferase involved in cell wall biosynthesis